MDDFYKIFEDRWRGSEDRIMRRHEVYLPFLQPLHRRYSEGRVFDLGCGRGEWLRLLYQHQIDAVGVDMDEMMVFENHTKGLHVVHDDALSFLREQDDRSAIAVTAFQLVEHLPFETLRRLVEEAMRVLIPGGILILETPNPENIRVATERFYLDPTHLRPVPSGLLDFLLAYQGFQRRVTMRLHEPSGIAPQRYANIAQVIEEVSPDYAIVAQKPGDPQMERTLEEPFSKQYGVSLANLFEKHERRWARVETMAEKALKTIGKAEESAWRSEIHASKAEEYAKKAEEYAKKAEEEAQKHTLLLEELKENTRRLEKVFQSRSWRWTAPFRYATSKLKRIKAWLLLRPDTRPGIYLRQHLRTFFIFLYDKPYTKKWIRILVYRHPMLLKRVRSFLDASSLEGASRRETDRAKVQLEAPFFHTPDIETILHDLEKTSPESKSREER